MVGYHKKPKVKPIPDTIKVDEIEAIAEGYAAQGDPLTANLIRFLYLYGARISEALVVRRRDITIEESEGVEVLVVTLVTRKNRRTPFRVLPVKLEGIAGDMAARLLDYCRDMPPEAMLFPITRRQAWHFLHKTKIEGITAIYEESREIVELPEFRLYPHYLRHCRLTHLKAEYSFDNFRLMLFAGWSNMEMAKTYVHLDWRDLLRGMVVK